MTKKINNPYLTIINKYNKFNADNYKDLEYVTITVQQGDQGKNTSTIETQTLAAYERVYTELKNLGGNCWINSAVRTEDDQRFAIEEKFNQIYTEKLKIAGLDTVPQDELTESQQLLIEQLKQDARHETDEVTLPVGYSEHQSGLAIDIGVDMKNVRIPDKITASYPPQTPQNFLNFITRRLIMEKHGFILRYPESERLNEVTGVKKNESWHWRYIGDKHSQMIGKLREKVNKILNRKEEVLLEDYVKLLELDIKTDNEHDLLEQYADYFIKNILKIENTDELKV